MFCHLVRVSEVGQNENFAALYMEIGIRQFEDEILNWNIEDSFIIRWLIKRQMSGSTDKYKEV